MKKIIFLSIAAFLAVLVYAHNSQGQIKSYYSGDAVNFNNQLYVASTNTGSLEIFRLEDKTLKRLVQIRPFDQTYNRYSDFYDVKLVPENGRLFAYAISGFTLYKYELLNSQLVLVASRQNTYWEWYNRVDLFGDDLVTISEKGVKVWNTDLMDVITALPLANSASPYNLRASNNEYVLNIAENNLEIYNRETGTVQKSIALNYKKTPGNHQAYQDQDYDLYVVDDYYAKKFNLNGQLLGSFRHLDYDGYDLTASGHTDYVYFSNGLGVVKLNSDTMTLNASRETVNLGGPRGWAMGLEVVYMGGDKVVVFNNGNILVLDDKLNLQASYMATAEMSPAAQENLYLNLDRNIGSAQSTVTLQGGGFFPGESLNIDFAGVIMSAKADNRGRFSQALTVPNLPAQRRDIKVTGSTSGLHFSAAFTIQ